MTLGHRRWNPKLGIVVACWIAALACSSQAQAQTQTIQKWVDEKGVVHFGDVPPPEAKTTSVQVHVIPPGELPPKPVQAPAKSGSKAASSKPEWTPLTPEEIAAREEGRKAAARAQECQQRSAQVARDGQAARRFGSSPANDSAIAKEDDWLAKNCN